MIPPPTYPRKRVYRPEVGGGMIHRFRLVFLLGLIPTLSAAVTAPTIDPPQGLCGTRQDAQAVLLTWDNRGNDGRYNLYGSFDTNPPDFHLETPHPLKQYFIVWDAPRTRKRIFVFYLTAVDKEGLESAPSEQVRVDLDAPPPYKECPPKKL